MKEYYKHQYLELIDTASNALEGRFDTETWQFLSKVEKALVTVPVDISIITNFYGNDFDDYRLNLHIKMFHDLAKERKLLVNTINDITEIFKSDTSKPALLSK